MQNMENGIHMKSVDSIIVPHSDFCAQTASNYFTVLYGADQEETNVK